MNLFRRRGGEYRPRRWNGHHPTGRTALVGRVGDRAVLADLVARTVEGQGGAVLLTGEPGIGKTRLAEDAADRASALGLTPLWGRCRESAGAPPFWPWTQVLRGLGSTALGGRTAHDDVSRFQVFEMVTGVLAAAADTHPCSSSSTTSTGPTTRPCGCWPSSPTSCGPPGSA